MMGFAAQDNEKVAADASSAVDDASKIKRSKESNKTIAMARNKEGSRTLLLIGM